jgi:hypothetical protein
MLLIVSPQDGRVKESVEVCLKPEKGAAAIKNKKGTE